MSILTYIYFSIFIIVIISLVIYTIVMFTNKHKNKENFNSLSKGDRTGIAIGTVLVVIILCILYTIYSYYSLFVQIVDRLTR